MYYFIIIYSFIIDIIDELIYLNLMQFALLEIKYISIKDIRRHVKIELVVGISFIRDID